MNILLLNSTATSLAFITLFIILNTISGIKVYLNLFYVYVGLRNFSNELIEFILFLLSCRNLNIRLHSIISEFSHFESWWILSLINYKFGDYACSYTLWFIKIAFINLRIKILSILYNTWLVILLMNTTTLTVTRITWLVEFFRSTRYDVIIIWATIENLLYAFWTCAFSILDCLFLTWRTNSAWCSRNKTCSLRIF